MAALLQPDAVEGVERIEVRVPVLYVCMLVAREQGSILRRSNVSMDGTKTQSSKAYLNCELAYLPAHELAGGRVRGVDPRD